MTLQIYNLLDDKSRNEAMPEAVAMAAETLCCDATVPQTWPNTDISLFRRLHSDS